MIHTYLTTAGLASRIPYDERTIREQLKNKLFIEGVHYIRPSGPRGRLLYIWEAIERDLLNGFQRAAEVAIPMASGGTCRG
jgi:hypothetical protein